MELWVRSQDRETLMKVNKIDKYGVSIITFNNDCEAIYLGRYETEKRALEVLDEIQNKIKYMGKTYEIGTMEDERIIPHQFNYVDNVYKMPKE